MPNHIIPTVKYVLYAYRYINTNNSQYNTTACTTQLAQVVYIFWTSIHTHTHTHTHTRGGHGLHTTDHQAAMLSSWQPSETEWLHACRTAETLQPRSYTHGDTLERAIRRRLCVKRVGHSCTHKTAQHLFKLFMATYFHLLAVLLAAIVFVGQHRLLHGLIRRLWTAWSHTDATNNNNNNWTHRARPNLPSAQLERQRIKHV